MNSIIFANVVSQILPKVNMPASAENVKALTEVYRILGQLERGELILAPPASIVPKVEGNAK